MIFGGTSNAGQNLQCPLLLLPLAPVPFLSTETKLVLSYFCALHGFTYRWLVAIEGSFLLGPNFGTLLTVHNFITSCEEPSMLP